MRSPRTLNMTSSVSMVWRKLSIVVMTTSLCMLAQQLIAVDAAHWGSFSQAKCISPGYMKYYSRLWDIQGDWSTACKEAPATINGVYYTSPENCVDKGVSGMWGEWKVEDSSCNTNWGSFQDDGCKSNGCRQFSSIIWDIPSGVYWEDWCQQSSADISGQHFARPTRCVNTKLNIWGEFDFVDSSCGQCIPFPNFLFSADQGDSEGPGRLTTSSSPPSYSPPGSP